MSKPKPVPKPRFFRSADDLRRWLEKNHGSARELWVGFHKKDSGKAGITYPEAVDQALCFGWIDGIRKGIDEASYTNRFTPRRKGSSWSNVNTKRVAELRKMGMMHAAGIEVFENRDLKKAGVYSFEQKNLEFSPAQLKRFKIHKKAWEFFCEQPPSYRRPATWWVISAKKDETKTRRLETLIADSARGERIAPLRRPER
jgi:uncharacterized protein YdeI (YjbR/CyaY-like superfamily)